MQKASRPKGRWQNVLFPLTALLIVAADQLTKVWIRSYPEEPPIFQAGFFQVINRHNTGAAFGLFQGQSFALTIVALIGVGILLLYSFLVHRHLPFLDTKLGRIAMGLILGGTVGNLVDRLYFGYVTDFVDFGFWPAFNVADSAITIGVILFIVSILLTSRAEKA